MARLAVIENEKLRNLEEKKIIQSKCPVNRTGKECMYFEGEKLFIDEILCIGCGICVKLAPSAIEIINLPDDKKRGIIHQYGLNKFRIFNLPHIQENTITGIVGRNGIGKSTVINVLSKTIEANFGELDKKKENYFEFIIQKFKGSVLQTYFTKLQKGEISVAYKPQQITNISKLFKGTVIDLLSKTSSKTKVEEIAKKLNITKIVNRNINVLSGGELQKVALAATLLKENCNFFVFDEITNYLDIYERLNSSKIIKETLKDKTSLIVEHDLIVLDYLCEFTQIMYGSPGAYGMLTGIKSARVGINDYLEGYSKEENVKFRDKPITFEKDVVIEDSKIKKLVEWHKEKITVGEFNLEINGGEIKKGEIMGIIGRNALGKSTFIKHIKEKGLKEGDEFENISVSYKAQLIEKNSNLVEHELCAFKNYEQTFYRIYVLDILNIDAIKEKKINQLSGGELQRYAIAKCLLEDADIYLFDEPTAFLDIEDRLKVAKMIKNFMETKDKSAFIIDHDIVFMDYLSNRLLVFDGEPSVKGIALSPFSMREGMNTFLKNLNITFRRDEHSKRPRVNKEGSVKDQEQKKSGEYYYS